MRDDYWEKDGYRRILYPNLNGNTIVHDTKNNRQVMVIQGVVVLPVGAEVELLAPNVNAKVVGVRLLAGDESEPVQVCLDVEVPEEYYDRKQA